MVAGRDWDNGIGFVPGFLGQNNAIRYETAYQENLIFSLSQSISGLPPVEQKA